MKGPTAAKSRGRTTAVLAREAGPTVVLADAEARRLALGEVARTSHRLRTVLLRLLASLTPLGVQPADPPAVQWRSAALPVLRRGAPVALAA